MASLTDHGAAGLSGLAGEQHFSPTEIAGLRDLSKTKIRRLFEREAGVLRIGEPSQVGRQEAERSYYTMRIPETVAPPGFTGI